MPDALVVGAANHHADPSVHRVTAEWVLDGVILLKTRRQRAGRGEPGTKLAAEAPAQRLNQGGVVPAEPTRRIPARPPPPPAPNLHAPFIRIATPRR